MDKNWPVDFPKDCPPESSFESNDTFYRLVDVMPPTKDDFIRTRDNPSHKDKDHQGDALINSYGVSLFKEPKDAVNTKKRFKKAMAHKKIAGGVIDPDTGKLAQTGMPSHHTAWFYVGAEPELSFTNQVEET